MSTKNIRKLLNQVGLRFTNQRHYLMEVLLKSQTPLSAEDIYLSEMENNRSINLSTVYRILEQLVEKGLVEKTFLGDENKAYYLLHQGHKHFVTCLNCKKMQEIEDCPIHEIEDSV